MTTDHPPPLLALSAELRNQIYRLSLIGTEPVRIGAETKTPEPGLLRTCRQIRAETLAIFWGETTFEANESVYLFPSRFEPVMPDAGAHISAFTEIRYPESCSALRVWLRNIGPARAALINTIIVRFQEYGSHGPECRAGPKSHLRATVSTIETIQRLTKRRMFQSAGTKAATVMFNCLREDGLSPASIKPVIATGSRVPYLTTWLEEMNRLIKCSVDVKSEESVKSELKES